MSLPRLLKANALFIGGIYIATAETITLPKMGNETEDWRGGAMSAAVKAKMGITIGQLELGFKGMEFAAFRAHAAQGLAGEGFRAVGVYEDDATGATYQVQTMVRGRSNDLDPGALKVKDGGATTVKIDPVYLKVVSDTHGELCEIDILNGVERWFGKDVNANIRNKLTI